SAVSTYRVRIGSPQSSVSWIWCAGALLAAGGLISVVRYAPWLEGTRFRIEKAFFLLRRRYGPTSDSSGGARSAPHDYSGETFSGHYYLKRAVSQGGFSVVYEARDLED